MQCVAVLSLIVVSVVSSCATVIAAGHGSGVVARASTGIGQSSYSPFSQAVTGSTEAGPGPARLYFIDEDGDGFNDLLPDVCYDGVPDYSHRDVMEFSRSADLQSSGGLQQSRSSGMPFSGKGRR